EMDLLRHWFAGNKFSDDRLQCGLELEGWLIDGAGAAAPDNTLFLQTLERDCVVPELAKFNFEVNVKPQYLAGNGLRDMRLELGATWDHCSKVAKRLGHHILSIGILPTVTNEMLCIANMSPLQRYAALNKQVLKMRGGSPLLLNIEGVDRLKSTHSSLMLEAAATSIQIHLKIPQRLATRYYNASMIASCFTCASAANSPLLFGKRLWDDTRITVFEQAVDTGAKMPRVSFGSGYVQESILELFEQNMQRTVLLPAELEEPPAVMPYTRMHNGTVWTWNRPLIGFESDGQPHLRIEHRPMSASPSVEDLFADVALYLGLTQFLANLQIPPETCLSFADAEANFYAAARSSLTAEIKWIDGKRWAINELLRSSLLDEAMLWLETTGACHTEILKAHELLCERFRRGQNGAIWQARRFGELGRDSLALQRAYEDNQALGIPVHEWN
ncbi:MAG: glutamate--cysteine ligase, partial [Planctomycetota bacterium]